MATDYEKIRKDNRKAYGEIGAEKMGNFASERLYSDRTHFIYELLQNAEDALKRRGGAWNGRRRIVFILEADQLRVEHYGEPFTTEDVHAICDFGESTKREDRTEIGQFGIGFKSVYAYTSEPVISSGDEHFSIREYVYPYSAECQHDDSECTSFMLPFKECDSALEEIANTFKNLHPRTLLFLDNLEEIIWRIPDGVTGTYHRKSTIEDERVRRVSLRYQCVSGDTVKKEDWLIFFRPVDHGGRPAGKVQIAFMIDPKEHTADNVQNAAAKQKIQFNDDCVMFARFATDIETHLGLLVDGPYITTLARDNIPAQDPFNRKLVDETAELLVESLRWLQDKNMLNVTAFQCVLGSKPWDASYQPMLRPLFDEAKQALQTEALLPRHGGGYTTARKALSSRKSELRDLFSSDQLEQLYEPDTAWLDGSLHRVKEVREFIKEHLEIREEHLDSILDKMTKGFLEAQRDEWIQNLYVFLNNQEMDWQQNEHVKDLEIVRLKSGAHISAVLNGKPQAYLPSDGETAETDYLVVSPNVCKDKEALQFLETKLQLREWDQVDDLIFNLLPKYDEYNRVASNITNEEYAADIERMITAWESSKQSSRKTKLQDALKKVAWVRAVDTETKSRVELCTPPELYLNNDDLLTLFDGFEGALIVDPNTSCLKGSDIKELLTCCGTSDSLRPIDVEVDYPQDMAKSQDKWIACKNAENEIKQIIDRFTWAQLLRMRIDTLPDHKKHGSKDDKVTDYYLHDLLQLVEVMNEIGSDDSRDKAKALWNLLVDMKLDSNKTKYFRGTYSWERYGPQKCEFSSVFLLTLRDKAWIPDPHTEDIHKPCDIEFKDLGWQHNADLERDLKFGKKQHTQKFEQLLKKTLGNALRMS